MKSMLLNRKNYNWVDLAWLAGVMLNNAVNPVTKVTPYQAVFGEAAKTECNIGLRLTRAKMPLILDASLRRQAKDLADELRAMHKEVKREIEHAKLITWGRKNKGKVSHSFQVGDVIFIKDNRLPPPGGNPKLRPALQKSPFVITGVNSYMLKIMRIVDKMPTRITPKDAVKYEASNEHLFKDIPAAVLAELGSRFTPKKLLALAEADELPLLFVEDVLIARKNTDKRKRRKVMTDPDASGSVADDDAANDDAAAADDDGWEDDEDEGVRFAETDGDST